MCVARGRESTLVTLPDCKHAERVGEIDDTDDGTDLNTIAGEYACKEQRARGSQHAAESKHVGEQGSKHARRPQQMDCS